MIDRAAVRRIVVTAEYKQVFVGLGSNLDNPVAHVCAAFSDLKNINGIEVIANSSLYKSKPLDDANQPDYINAVTELKTTLSSIQLLEELQRIEDAHGRVRNGERWHPRTLDLDLLLFADEVIATLHLTVPHSELAKREFVLYPLYEIAPGLMIPGQGALQDLIDRCPQRALQRLEEICESKAS